MVADRQDSCLDDDAPALVRRIHAEFEEMPGLELTAAQAARLWWLTPAVCERLLAGMVEARYLTRTAGGRFRRPTAR